MQIFLLLSSLFSKSKNFILLSVVCVRPGQIPLLEDSTYAPPLTAEFHAKVSGYTFLVKLLVPVHVYGLHILNKKYFIKNHANLRAIPVEHRYPGKTAL